MEQSRPILFLYSNRKALETTSYIRRRRAIRGTLIAIISPTYTAHHPVFSFKLTAFPQPTVPSLTQALSDADDPQLQIILEEKMKAQQASLKLSPQNPHPSSQEHKEPTIRIQIIVPLSSASKQLTPLLLQRLFSIRGIHAQQLLLGLVDGNGMVSRSCLYNYIQSPLEGPGTADLELLDD